MIRKLLEGETFRVTKVEEKSGWYPLRSNIEKYVIEIITGSMFPRGTFTDRDFIVHAHVRFLTGPWRGVKYKLTNISVRAVEKRQ